MAKYRKKPVVIDAIQFNEETRVEIAKMKDAEVFTGGPFHPTPGKLLFANIKTLEGDMAASVGDYIITDIKGERYPCKPDIFEATYELVESEES